MKILMLTLALLLTGCCRHPTEPEILVDVCIDTFSDREAGYTVTIRPGDSIVIRIEPPTVRLDSL